MENVDYALPGNSKVNFVMTFEEYYQTQGLLVTGSLSDKAKLKKSDLTAGRLPENPEELVVDEMVVKNMIKLGNARELGIKTGKDILGRTLKQPNMPDMKIVGLSNRQTPSIYVDRSKMIPIILHDPGQSAVDEVQNPQYAAETDAVLPYSDYANTGNLHIVKGEAPTKDFEVLVPEALKDEVAIGKPINVKVKGNYLIVTGYYHDDRKGGGLYVTDNTYFINVISKYKTLTISTKNKAALIESLKGSDVRVIDVYKENKQSYVNSISKNIWKAIAVSSVIVFVSLIEMYLMLRASFLSRIKEVGVLRAIGLKKGDIYRMFTGEVIAITLITALPGMGLMAYFINALTKIDLFDSMYRMNPLVFGISFLIVLGFNMIAGLLPVFTTLRKTPAAILARNDIS